jgi:hypothetical protein
MSQKARRIMADLTSAFNDCLDRLNRGQSIEDCLHAYPQDAAQLRALLETVWVVRRAAPPEASAAARARVRAQVMQAAAQMEQSPRRPFWTVQRLGFAASLVVVLAVVGILILREPQRGGPRTESLLTPTVITQTPTPTPSSMPTLTSTPTPTNTPTNAPTATHPAATPPPVPMDDHSGHDSGHHSGEASHEDE